MGRSYIGEEDRRGEQAEENSMCKGPVAGRSLGTKKGHGGGKTSKRVAREISGDMPSLVKWTFLYPFSKEQWKDMES